MVSNAQTVTDNGTLTLASRMRRPAITLRAITANGLTTRKSVENGERDKKRNGEYGDAPKASRLKNWFVGAHNSSLSKSNIAQVCNGR